MIFVAVGTQFPFDRLVRFMDEWAAENEEQVIAQIGEGSYTPKHMEFERFMDGEQYNKNISEASVFVSHAGMGNIISAKYHIPIKEAQKRLHDELKGTYTSLAERVHVEKALNKEILLSNLDVWWEITSGRDNGAYATIMDSGMPGIAKLLSDNVSNGKLSKDIQRENMKAGHLWFKALDLFAKINILLLYSFAAIGFIIAVRNMPSQRILHVFIAGMILYYYIITFGHEGAGYSRGRMTFIPLVMLYSGYGVVALIKAIMAYKLNKSDEHPISLKNIDLSSIRKMSGVT